MNKIKFKLLFTFLLVISLNVKSQGIKKPFQVSEIKNNRELKIEIKESFYRQILIHPLITEENKTEIRAYYLDHLSRYKKMVATAFKKKQTILKDEMSLIFSGIIDQVIADYNKDKRFMKFKAEYHVDDDGHAHEKKGGGDKGPGDPCINMGFDNCDYTGWVLTQGEVNATAFAFINPVATTNWGSGSNVGHPDVLGSSSDQHYIVNAGTDPNAPIQMVNPLGGGTCSSLIGDGNGTGSKASKISQTFLVSAANADFSYSYAAVLEDPSGHTLGEKPYFRAQVIDQNGNPIVCGNFQSTAGDGSAGWINNGTIQYRDWSTVIVPLQAYIGQNVTVEFTVGDCSQSGHYGYAYVEASCTPLEIVPSDTVVCGAPVVLQAPTPFNGTYLWNTGATTSSITTSTPGFYTVDMITAPGCFITLDVTILADSTQPIANFVADTVCGGNATAFTDLSTTSVGAISNWDWDFNNDGTVDNTTQNPSFTFTGPGVYPVNLATGIGSCGHDTTINVYVNALPIADFSFTNECFGTSTQFTDLSNPSGGVITTWQWDFDNNGAVDNTTQNPSNGYAAAGTYTAELYVSAGACSDSITKQIVVNPVPVANFSASIVCLGAPNVFTDLSSVTTGNIASWAWDFGDASGTSVLQNPTYTYSTAGSYNVTLTVISDSGCTHDTTIVVEVYSNPIADFTATTPCIGSATQFTDQSIVGSINLSNWSWDFDADAIADDNNQNPTYTFPSTGAFPVNLSIVDTNGCTHDTIITVDVSPKPVAEFSFTNECFGSATGFTDLSTTPSGTITSWTWDFNNNNVVDNITQNPSNGYPSAGTYDAELLVTNSFGCIDSTILQIVVNPIPIANFGTSSSCLGLVTVFTDSSTVTTGNITSWSWDFGDATGASILQNPTYTYAAAGNYNVTLTVTSDSGCIHTFNTDVDIFPNPTAAFTTNDVCLNVLASFTDNSNGNGDVINDWAWDFGNASGSSSIQNPSYAYLTDGAYITELIITTVNGCKDTVTGPINIFPMPTADFTFVNACMGTAIAFTDNSSITSGTINNWDWNFGNTNTSIIQSPSENYAIEGVYNVQLIATSDNSCKDTITKTIEVWPTPVVNFSPTEVCLNALTQFTDLSTVSNNSTVNSVTGWSWGFNGLGNSVVQNPTFTFTSEGVLPTTLIVTTNNGCTDSITLNVTVNPLPQISFGPDTAGCATLCLTMNNTSTISSGTLDVFSWDFGDGSSSGSQQPSYCFENESNSSVMTYDVTLTATSNKGCSSTLTNPQMITVYPIPLAHFTVDPEITDELNKEISFTDLSIIASAWNWDMGDGTFSTSTNPIHEFPSPGNFLVTLYIENQYGCKDTTDKLVKIDPTYAIWIPNVFTPDGDGINEYFSISGFGLKDVDLRIFDRWGIQVFHQQGNPEDVYWNGVYKGDVVQEDVYVYKVKVKDIFNKYHDIVGRVTVIK